MSKHYRHEIEQTGEAELPLLRDLVRPGDLTIDIGANLGVYAYELARLTGRVLAFEPNPDLAKLLKAVRPRGAAIYQVALSDTDGEAELLVPTGHGAHGIATLRRESDLGDAVERVSVPTRRLDTYKLHGVRFIKIDVEGFEEQVLEGAAETIARDHPILLVEIEERHNPGGLGRIRDRLRAAGYRGLYYRGGEWQPLDRFDPEVHQRADGDVLEIGKTLTRRSADYINNFLFVPANDPRIGLN
jgi:FkbM family methyltransferase